MFPQTPSLGPQLESNGEDLALAPGSRRKGRQCSKPIIPEVCFNTNSSKSNESQPQGQLSNPHISLDGASRLVTCSQCCVRVHASKRESLAHTHTHTHQRDLRCIRFSHTQSAAALNIQAFWTAMQIYWSACYGMSRRLAPPPLKLPRRFLHWKTIECPTLSRVIAPLQVSIQAKLETQKQNDKHCIFVTNQLDGVWSSDQPACACQ